MKDARVEPGDIYKQQNGRHQLHCIHENQLGLAVCRAAAGLLGSWSFIGWDVDCVWDWDCAFGDNPVSDFAVLPTLNELSAPLHSEKIMKS